MVKGLLPTPCLPNEQGCSMRTKIAIGLLTVVAVLAWMGVAGAQATTPGGRCNCRTGTPCGT
jgi:hypothetical protein